MTSILLEMAAADDREKAMRALWDAGEINSEILAYMAECCGWSADLPAIVTALRQAEVAPGVVEAGNAQEPCEPKTQMYRKTALVQAEQFLPNEGKIPSGVYSSERADPRKNPLADWVLNTLEGPHYLRDGDYICTGPAGEQWNVERSIFKATYEPVNAAPSADAAMVEAVAQAMAPSVFVPFDAATHGSPVNQRSAQAMWRKHAETAVQTIAALDLASRQPAGVKANEWREAVIDALVCSHIYREDHDSNPRLALHEAIAWDVAAALDPAVSRDAALLVNDGYTQAMRHAAKINREMQAVIGAQEGSSIYAALIACVERMDEIAQERLIPAAPATDEGEAK